MWAAVIRARPRPSQKLTIGFPCFRPHKRIQDGFYIAIPPSLKALGVHTGSILYKEQMPGLMAQGSSLMAWKRVFIYHADRPKTSGLKAWHRSEQGGLLYKQGATAQAECSEQVATRIVNHSQL